MNLRTDLTILLALGFAFPMGNAFAKAKGEIPKLGKKPSASVAGTWSGSYMHTIKIIVLGDFDPKREPRQKVNFVMHLRDTPDGFEGEVTEPNNDPAATNPTHFARVKGTRDGSRIRFTKTYETDPAVDQYEGTLDESGKTMSGKWVMGERTDTFEATRISGPPATPTPTATARP